MTEAQLRRRKSIEAEVLGLRPWELAPCEVDDGPCPYPPNTGGGRSWARAKELKAELDRLLGDGPA